MADDKKKDYCGMNTKTSQFPESVLMGELSRNIYRVSSHFWVLLAISDPTYEMHDIKVNKGN